MTDSGSISAPAGPKGLEWVLLRLLPVVGVAGVILPLLGLGLAHAVLSATVDSARLEMLEFWLMGATVVYWSVFMTVLVGCAMAWAFRRGRSMLFSPPSSSDRT